jgi:lipid A 3-O-deacylase
MHLYFKIALVVSLLGAGAPILAEHKEAGRPWETGAIDLESGMLWQIGTGTPLSYRLVPTQLSWRSREFVGREFDDGSRLMIRHRLTLIGTWVEQGPESRYVGFSGSPSIEWWNRAGTWSFFTGAGGGCGWIDSRAVPGAQGQDFTLNWFIRGGVEHVTARNLRLSAGILYQHLSNGGRTDPNPGIDALGFTLGGGWAF